MKTPYVGVNNLYFKYLLSNMLHIAAVADGWFSIAQPLLK